MTSRKTNIYSDRAHNDTQTDRHIPKQAHKYWHPERQKYNQTGTYNNTQKDKKIPRHSAFIFFFFINILLVSFSAFPFLGLSLSLYLHSCLIPQFHLLCSLFFLSSCISVCLFLSHHLFPFSNFYLVSSEPFFSLSIPSVFILVPLFSLINKSWTNVLFYCEYATAVVHLCYRPPGVLRADGHKAVNVLGNSPPTRLKFSFFIDPSWW